MKLGQSTDSEP